MNYQIMPGVSKVQPVMKTSNGIFNVSKPFRSHKIDSEIVVTMLKLSDKT